MGVKITDLTEHTAQQAEDLLEIVDMSGTPTSKKIKVGTLLNRYTKTVRLSVAEITKLNSIPVDVISAVPGKTIVIEEMVSTRIDNGGAMTPYTGGTTFGALTETANTFQYYDEGTLLDGTLRTAYGIKNELVAAAASTTQHIEGKKVQLYATGSDPATGNFEIDVTLIYFLL